MNETIFFCPKCKTKTHWANEPCPKDVSVVERESMEGVVQGGGREQVDPGTKDESPGRKLGFDRKKYQREYMRRYRAR